MFLRHQMLSTIFSMLLGCLSQPTDDNVLKGENPWKAYLLTGGEYVDDSYRWLLLSQLSIQELASAETQRIANSGQDRPLQDVAAVWMLTHRDEKNWTSVQSLAVPPPISNFQPEKQRVSVDGVEYKVESVPFADTIPLLRKEQERMLRSSIGPLYITNRTAKALKDFVESETQKGELANVPTKLGVASSFGGERSVINSTIAESEPGSGTLHGLQVSLGPEKRLRELSVYDNGFLQRRETYIEDGFELAHEQFSPSPLPGGHGGQGYRRVDGRGIAGTPPATLAEGYLLDGKPWHGNFVLVESIPGSKSYEHPVRLVLREYFEGKIVATKTDVTLGFIDLEKEQTWLKKLPSVLQENP